MFLSSDYIYEAFEALLDRAKQMKTFKARHGKKLDRFTKARVLDLSASMGLRSVLFSQFIGVQDAWSFEVEAASQPKKLIYGPREPLVLDFTREWKKVIAHAVWLHVKNIGWVLGKGDW
jgi:hypothetical protein